MRSLSVWGHKAERHASVKVFCWLARLTGCLVFPYYTITLSRCSHIVLRCSRLFQLVKNGECKTVDPSGHQLKSWNSGFMHLNRKDMLQNMCADGVFGTLEHSAEEELKRLSKKVTRKMKITEKKRRRRKPTIVDGLRWHQWQYSVCIMPSTLSSCVQHG